MKIDEYETEQLLRWLDCVYFHQHGTTSHTSNDTIALMREKFPDRVIFRRGDPNWPPRSCDLTSSDFLLWGYVKGKVYANGPQSNQYVKNAVREVIEDIQPQMCE